jgi:site-specific recombinase XerD
MDILEQFTRYIQQIGYSKGSQYQIPSCIKEFLGQVAEPNIRKINQQDILDFYQYLQTRPLKRRPGALSEAMIGHYVFGLKTFFNWLEQSGQIKYNPISNIKFKSPQGNPREPLSQKEILELFEAAQTSKETAILHLFYSCGLRRSEAENLNTPDIHFSKNLLYIREGKGAKRRAIPINEKVKKALENYLINCKLLMVDCKCKDAYMVNSNGDRMRGNSYNKILKQLLVKAEITKEASLHHLRHSIATHLLENGLSIEFVRDFLGHSHLEATQIYAKVPHRLLKKL